MLSLMKDFAESTTDLEDTNEKEESHLSANAATQMTIQNETLKVLAQLQKQLENLTDEVKGGQNRNRNNFKKTPDDPPPPKKK